MSVEVREDNAQIVFNHRSGVSPIGRSPGAAIAQELQRLVPSMPVFSFTDALVSPERLDRPNTIVIGGDGSTVETAKRVPGVIFPLDGSTSGVIQTSLGFKRHPFEDPYEYTNRVITILTSGAYDVVSVPSRMVHRARPYEELHLPIVFRAGMGTPTIRYLESMESLRGKLPNRLRVFAGLVNTLSAASNAPLFTVVQASTARTVLDAQIYKTPFMKSRMILTPDITHDVLVTMNATPLPSRIPRLALDAFMIMILRHQPHFGGISVIPLSHDSSVYIHSPRAMASTLQIDGEKHAGVPIAITGSGNNGVVYQFAAIR